MFKRENGKEIIIQQEYKNGQHLIKNYIKGNLLGKGGFAKCYQIVSQQTNIKYAVKIIQKASLTKSKAKQKLQSQISIHRSLKHKNIVNFQHFFQDHSFVYILLEICRPETLNDLIKRRKRITQFQAKYYIYQIANALKYVHDQKIIHRDLKLGNLFLSEGLQIKVGDFGLATKIQFDNQRKKTMCGTPNYIAPQILQNKKGHSYEVDIWSLGVITYALIFGRPPFETTDLKLTYNKIKSCNYSFPDNAKKFITRILQLQPHKRPTLDQILNDQFLQSIEIPKSLPISTISVPPSANLIKKYQKCEDQPSRQQQKSQQNKSFNSFKILQRNKAMMSTDKLERIQKNQTLKKQQKNPQSPGSHMNRAASTAALLGRKKTNMKQVNLNVAKENVPIKVIFYQENPKFGTSYMLSTNAIGMRYNDSTCIVSNSHLTKLKYVVMEPSLKQISVQTFDYVQTPQNLQKKLKIINFYSKELKKKKDQMENKISYEMRMQLQRMKAKQTHLNALTVYVTRSIKTSKAIFFQFNNGFIQVIFEDSSQLIFSFEEVTYINKFSQLKIFKTAELNYQSEDIKKRMNYAYSVTQKVKKNIESKQNRIQNQRQSNDKKNIGRSISSSKFAKNLTKQGRSYQSTNKLTTTNVLKQVNFNKFA